MKTNRLALFILLPCLLLGCSTAQHTANSEPAEPLSPMLAEFHRRTELSRQELPTIEAAAEAAARRIVAHPDALINVPYAPQGSFAEEILNRAGGLANALPPEERPKAVTPNDVLLVSARCWELDHAKALAMIAQGRAHGWLIVLFASRAGMPADISADFVIDNGATSGAQDQAGMNAILNSLNAWLWNCEYTAALTRQGKYPGVLLSILMPQAKEFDAKIQSREGRYFLGQTDKAIPAGELAGEYLTRVAKLEESVASAAVQESIRKAAQIIATKLNSGGHVYVASCTHVLMGEVMPHEGEHLLTPMQGLIVVWRAKAAFAKAVKPTDLVVWFGYVGMSTPNEDYATPIRDTHAPFIACYATDDNAANNASDALVHIEQTWRPPDAEITLPFPPGQMAPISGIDQGLLYRMLEDEVAHRLTAAPPEHH